MIHKLTCDGVKDESAKEQTNRNQSIHSPPHATAHGITLCRGRQLPVVLRRARNQRALGRLEHARGALLALAPARFDVLRAAIPALAVRAAIGLAPRAAVDEPGQMFFKFGGRAERSIRA